MFCSGRVKPFPNLTMFNQTVYLGVTVDDGEPATADVEMRPRQAIVPVIAAVHAAEADRAHALLGGIPGELPVGGIAMYFGNETRSSGKLEDLQWATGSRFGISI